MSAANFYYRGGRRLKYLAPGPVLGYEDERPIVPVTIGREPRVTLFLLAACPFCGRPHIHGGRRPEEDPRRYQGHRPARCVPDVVRPERRRAMERGYILRIVGEEPERPRPKRRTAPSSRSSRPRPSRPDKRRDKRGTTPAITPSPSSRPYKGRDGTGSPASSSNNAGEPRAEVKAP
jgi:hypothetical protein